MPRRNRRQPTAPNRIRFVPRTSISFPKSIDPEAAVVPLEGAADRIALLDLEPTALTAEQAYELVLQLRRCIALALPTPEAAAELAARVAARRDRMHRPPALLPTRPGASEARPGARTASRRTSPPVRPAPIRPGAPSGSAG